MAYTHLPLSSSRASLASSLVHEETAIALSETETSQQDLKSEDYSVKYSNQQQLIERNLLHYSRVKRGVTREIEAGNAISESQEAAQERHPITVDEIYEIFQESTKNRTRALFTQEQSNKILTFYRQEKESSYISTYDKIMDHYNKLGDFKELATKLDPEFKPIFDIIRNSPSPMQPLKTYVEKQKGERLAIAEQLLIKIKTASQFFTDLSSQDIIIPTHMLPLIFGSEYDQGSVASIIDTLKSIRENGKKIAQLSPGRDWQEYNNKLKNELLTIRDKTEKFIFLFKKYSDLIKQTEFLSAPLPTKDHFINISTFINHEKIRPWLKFQNFKKEFVFNLSKFFDLKKLSRPKERDNFQGADFERIDELVKDAIKKFKVTLTTDHQGYSDLEIRVYNEDKTNYITIDWSKIKHCAERHYSPTFNPSTKKIYNTKFKSEITLEKIVKIIYEQVEEEKHRIFESLDEHHAITFLLDRQKYNIGISINGNKTIQKGNELISNGLAKINEGAEKITSSNLITEEIEKAREKGIGQKLKKLGEKNKTEGEKLVSEGLRKKNMIGSYTFDQFYPEPRNAVVFVMSSQEISHPENILHLRQSIEAFGRRYKGYKTPMEYYALVYNEPSSGNFGEQSYFSIKQLTSDPCLAASSDSTLTTQKKWAWRSLSEQSLNGVYTKVTLMGYGSHSPEGGMVVQGGSVDVRHSIEANKVGQAFTTLFKNDTEIQHLRLLACHQKPEVFGLAIHKSLTKKGIKIERIIGSESEVYLSNKEVNSKIGIKAASKFYDASPNALSDLPVTEPSISQIENSQTSKKIVRGVEEVKWVLEVDTEGHLKGVAKRVTSHGNNADSTLDIAVHVDEFSGPFGKHATEVALQLQQATQDYSAAKKQLNEDLLTINTAINEAKNTATRTLNSTQSKWVADIDSLRMEGDHYFVSVVEKESLTRHKILLSQERGAAFFAVKERLKGVYEILQPHFEKTPEGHLRPKSGVQQTGNSGTLNVGFLAKALIEGVANKNLEIPWDLKISIYLNLSGSTVAVGGDVLEFTRLVVPNQLVERSLQIVGRAFEIGNLIFTAGGILWDTYQVFSTDDPVKKAELKISLGFNLSILGLQGAGCFIPEVAELGPLAIPLMGLGFGFSALGAQLAQHNTEVNQFYDFFTEYYKSVDEGAYRNHRDALLPVGNVPIAEINFREGILTFADVQITKTRPAQGLIQTASGATPHHVYAPGRGFEYFNALTESEKTIPLDINPPIIALSAVPPMQIDTQYTNVDWRFTEAYFWECIEFLMSPISTSGDQWDNFQKTERRIAEQKKVINRLKNVSGENFEPSNSLGNLKVKAQTKFISSTQKIILNEKSRVLCFPPKQSDLQIAGKVRFEVKGGGGTTVFRGLHSEISLKMTDLADVPSSYILEVSGENLIGIDDVAIIGEKNSKKLSIKFQSRTVSIDISGLNIDSKIMVIGSGASWNVNLNSGKIRMFSLDLRMVPHLMSLNLHLSYLNDLTDKGRTEDVIRLTQGNLLPTLNQNATAEEKKAHWQRLKEEDRLSTHSAYDSKKKRVIQPGSPLHNTGYLQRSKLVGITEKQVFFFHAEKNALWHMDRENLHPTHYELGFINENTRIESVGKIGDQIVIKQVSSLDSDHPTNEVALWYTVEGEKNRFVHLNGLNGRQFKKMISFLQNLKKEESSHFLGHHFLYDSKYAFGQATQLRAAVRHSLRSPIPFRNMDMAEWLALEGVDEDGFSQRILADFKKGYMVRLNRYQISHLQVVKNWAREGGADNFLFWSPENKKAYFARAEAGVSELSLSEIDVDGKEIVWHGPNEDPDKVDFITEGGKDVITVDSGGTVMTIMRTCLPLEIS